MEEKIKIIDEIIKHHPSYGIDKGWSKYTGGMKDSGQWFFRKMLDVSIEQLKYFLNTIISEQNKPPKQYTQEEINDMNTIVIGDKYITNKYQSDMTKKFIKEIELKLFFGK